MAECDVCQKAKHDTRAPTDLLQPLPIPELYGRIFRWTLWSGFLQATGLK